MAVPDGRFLSARAQVDSLTLALAL